MDSFIQPKLVSSFSSKVVIQEGTYTIRPRLWRLLFWRFLFTSLDNRLSSICCCFVFCSRQTFMFKFSFVVIKIIIKSKFSEKNYLATLYHIFFQHRVHNSFKMDGIGVKFYTFFSPTSNQYTNISRFILFYQNWFITNYFWWKCNQVICILTYLLYFEITFNDLP